MAIKVGDKVKIIKDGYYGHEIPIGDIVEILEDDTNHIEPAYFVRHTSMFGNSISLWVHPSDVEEI